MSDCVKCNCVCEPEREKERERERERSEKGSSLIFKWLKEHC